MGAHYAPHTPSHAARLAGRGALTAAAALALTGGTASLAFAHEAPSPQSVGHDVQEQVTGGAHKLSDASKKADVSKKVDAGSVKSSVKSHGESMKHQASDVAKTLKSKAPTGLPELPLQDIKADLGHAGDNAKNDIAHAKYNWTSAAKDGLTPAEASEQLGLMGDDAGHAMSNAKNDAGHWVSQATAGAPAQLPSVLSFT